MNETPIQITGSGDVEVFESNLMTVVALPYVEPAQELIAQEADSTEAQFPDAYLRITKTEPEGALEVANVYYFFNSITGFQDPMESQPGVGSSATVTVPKNSEGVVYFKLTLFPVTRWELEFLEEPPAAAQYVFYRPLANASRVNDGVTFSQRHFGLITVPSQMLSSPFL